MRLLSDCVIRSDRCSPDEIRKGYEQEEKYLKNLGKYFDQPNFTENTTSISNQERESSFGFFYTGFQRIQAAARNMIWKRGHISPENLK